MSMEKDTRETTVDTFDDDMSAERAKKRQRHGVPSSEKADGAPGTASYLFRSVGRPLGGGRAADG